MRPQTAAKRLERFVATALPNIERAAYEFRQLLHQAVLADSSGEYSLAKLRRMGHPYAKRHMTPKGRRAKRRGTPAIPYGDPTIINAQSGTFRGAWRVGVGMNRDQILVRAENRSRAADYLEFGTKRMIARPLPRKLEKTLAPDFKKRLIGAIRRSLQP